MQRALALSKEAAGKVSPNPAVGAVVVADGQVVGEGFTQPPGGAHAEIVALESAGGAARGATVYVTLEPCSHHGRTPPCADALLAAGVSRVVFAIEDPDPRVGGQGRSVLEAAGAEVEQGDGEDEASQTLEAYIKQRRTGLPFVVVKYAASLDGRIAASSGDSRWVSGPETLKWAHANRPAMDAMLVGSSTVLVDNPQLTARPEGVAEPRQPLRVVLDSSGRISSEARVLAGPGRRLVATTEKSAATWRQKIESSGAEVLVLPADQSGHVSLQALMPELAARDVLTLLVEGGGVVIGSFFDQRLVDKVTIILAPIVIGAASAPAPVAGVGALRMAGAVRLRDLTIDRLGDDILVTGYPIWPGTDA